MDCSMLGLPVHHHHYSNSHSSSWWCHPTISSYVVPFSSVFNLSQHQGLFRCVSSLHQVAKVLEFQLKHQSFQWIFIGNPKFPEDWLAGSCNPKDSQESSPTPQFKSINSALSFLSEKAVVTHSSTPAWKIPWTEPGRLQSMGLQRVRYNWATSLSLFTFMHWRRKWQPISRQVFLPGESIPGTGGAWWAAISGVAQSRTQLKQLSRSSFLYGPTLNIHTWLLEKPKICLDRPLLAK